MLRYLPALGEQGLTHELGLIPAAVGVTNGLRTSWSDVTKLMKGNKTGLFKYTWLKDIILRPAESTIALFDSGLFSVFGLVKKDKSFDVAKFFESYAPAYRDYINLVMNEVPENSKKHCFFVNLDTEFLFGIEKTSQFNDMLLKNCPAGSIVGTYHAADGKKYLDELIEKFDFIAVADGHSFEDDTKALNYVQATCEYIKNKRPEIKIHVLGRSDTDLFKAVGNLADTCDSSSYRCFGDEEVLRETNLRFRDFWAAGLNYQFAGGLESAKVEAGGTELTEMQYSALVIELLKIYSFITALNKYSPQVMRSNCPVRDAMDDFFGVPHEWWDTTGGLGARYLLAETKCEMVKGKSKQVKISKFLTEPVEGSVDLGSLVSKYAGKRKQDWAREAPKPEGF